MKGSTAIANVLKEAFHYIPTRGTRPEGDPRDVREAVQALLAARSPVVVAGQGIFYAEAWEELRELAELTQAPVMTTLNGKSAFPENHPLALGAGSWARPRAVDHFLNKADLVFGIGTSFTRSYYITPIPPGKTMAQVTLDEQDVNKDYAISYGVIGDAKAVLRQMIEEVKRQLGPNGRRGDDAVAREIRVVKEAWLSEWMPRLASDDTPISPYRVVWDLMNTVDRQRTTVTHDSGNPRDQMVPFCESLVPHGYLTPCPLSYSERRRIGEGVGG